MCASVLSAYLCPYEDKERREGKEKRTGEVEVPPATRTLAHGGRAEGSASVFRGKVKGKGKGATKGLRKEMKRERKHLLFGGEGGGGRRRRGEKRRKNEGTG